MAGPESEAPILLDSPGHVVRRRHDGWAVLWEARSDLAKAGFTPRSFRLLIVRDYPTTAERAFISDQCKAFQAKMLAWAENQNMPPAPSEPGYSQYIAEAVEQSAEKPTVSEGSYWPKTWREAVPLAVWGVLVFACGFEFIASATHGELWPSIYSGGGFVVLLAMLIHGKAFIDRLKALDASWMVGAALVLFALSIVSQQQAQFTGPSADEIASAVAKKMASQPTPTAPVATGDTWEKLTPAQILALEHAPPLARLCTLWPLAVFEVIYYGKALVKQA